MKMLLGKYGLKNAKNKPNENLLKITNVILEYGILLFRNIFLNACWLYIQYYMNSMKKALSISNDSLCYIKIPIANKEDVFGDQF